MITLAACFFSLYLLTSAYPSNGTRIVAKGPSPQSTTSLRYASIAMGGSWLGYPMMARGCRSSRHALVVFFSTQAAILPIL